MPLVKKIPAHKRSEFDKKMYGIGTVVTPAFEEGEMIKLLDKWMTYVNQVAGGTIELLEKGKDISLDFVKVMEETFISFLKKIGITIDTENGGFYKWIRNFDIEKYRDQLKYLPEIATKWVKEVIGKVVTLIKSVFDMISATISKFRMKVMEIFRKLSDAFESLSDTFKNKVLKANLSKIPHASQQKIANTIEFAMDIASKLVSKLSPYLTKIKNLVGGLIKNPSILKKINSIISTISEMFTKIVDACSKAKNLASPKLLKIGGFLGKWAPAFDGVYKLFKAVMAFYDENADLESTDINSFWYHAVGFLLAVLVFSCTALLVVLGFKVAAAVLSVSIISLAGFELYSGVDLLAMGVAPIFKNGLESIIRAKDVFFSEVELFAAKAERELEIIAGKMEGDIYNLYPSAAGGRVPLR